MTKTADRHRVHSAVRRAIQSYPGHSHTSETVRTLLIGFSGGIDSTALLHATTRVCRQTNRPLKVTAVHVNHSLRGDSTEQARHCRRIASALGIPLEVVSLPRPPTHNIEAHARARRYAACRVAARTLQADIFWTAHHGDDALETALLHWMRGTGSEGLTSLVQTSPKPPLPSWRTENFVFRRPLTELTRKDCERYVRYNDLHWYSDSSNRDPAFRRNQVRKRILPELRKTAGATESDAHGTQPLLRTLQNLRSEANFVSQQAEQWLGGASLPSNDPETHTIDTARLGSAHRAVAARGLVRLLRTLPTPVGWNRQQLEEIYHAAKARTTGTKSDVQTVCLRGAAAVVGPESTLLSIERDRGTRALDSRVARPIQVGLAEIVDGDSEAKTLPWFEGHLQISITERSDHVDPPTNPNNAWLDAAALPDTGELILAGPDYGRHHNNQTVSETSTRLRAIGSEGRKQLSELLRESGTPPPQRWKHPCLYDATDQAARLLWVPGARQADRTSITDSTRTVIRLVWNG